MNKDFKENAQRAAVCYSQYKKRKGRSKGAVEWNDDVVFLVPSALLPPGWSLKPDQLGVAAGCVGGLVKTRFNGSDFGTIVMSTYEVAS